jgi:NAD(P)-dependent dehydrogenase (short-subunit alcohol dehydrogenase family)
VLAARGARLVVGDVDARGLDATIAALGTGVEVRRLACDVSKPEDVEALAVEADTHFGGTDLVINNAGVAVGGEVGDVPLADWQWIMGVNLWGVIYGCNTFVPRFKKQGSGAVLNIASAAGLLAAPGMAPYNVTKAGVVALSETLYAELSSQGIGVTVLCPTFFQTNIGKSARSHDKNNAQDIVEKLMKRASIQAADVARIALEGVDKRELYVLPHEDGRWMWRLKRLAPGSFHHLIPKVMRFAK